MADLFRSARLIYRSVDNPEDQPFFLKVAHDRPGWANSAGSNIELGGKATAKFYMEYCADKALVAAIICLPPTDSQPDAVPVGVIHLRNYNKGMAHHRSTEIGINVLPEFQGKGYGSEAIRWITRYAFESAGVHHLGIGSYGYNTRALALYEKLGFKVEARRRESVWHLGRFWDIVELGMLEQEWKEIVKKEEDEAKEKGESS